MLLCAAALLAGAKAQATNQPVQCHETIQVTFPFKGEGNADNKIFPYQAVDIEVTYKAGNKLDFKLKNFILDPKAEEPTNVGHITLSDISYTEASGVKTLPTTSMKATIEDGDLSSVDEVTWLNHSNMFPQGVDVSFGENSTIDSDNNLDLTLSVDLGDMGTVKVAIGGDLPGLINEAVVITVGGNPTNSNIDILVDADDQGKLTLTLNDFTLPGATAEDNVEVGTIEITEVTAAAVAGKDDQKSFTVPEKAITIKKYTDGTNGMAGTEVKVTINDGLLYNGGEKIYVDLKVNAGSTAPLDNIQVKVGEKPAALCAPKAVKATSSEAIYDLNGRFCGTSLEALPAGTYINGGKLVNKK